MAIADLIGGGVPPEPRAGAIHHLDPRHLRPGFTAERARVHGQRAAQRARNAGEKGAARQAFPFAQSRQLGAGHAGLCAHRTGRQPPQGSQAALGGDDHAVDAAVTHQKIAAEPHPEQRHVGRQAGEKNGEIVHVRRLEKDFRRPADPPTGMRRQRLVIA